MEEGKIFQTSWLKGCIEIIIKERFGKRGGKRSRAAYSRRSCFYIGFLGKIKEAEPQHPSKGALLLRDTGLGLCKGYWGMPKFIHPSTHPIVHSFSQYFKYLLHARKGMQWGQSQMQSLPSLLTPWWKIQTNKKILQCGHRVMEAEQHSLTWMGHSKSGGPLGPDPPPRPTVLGLGPCTAFKLLPYLSASEMRAEHCIEHSSKGAQGGAAELRHVNPLPSSHLSIKLQNTKSILVPYQHFLRVSQEALTSVFRGNIEQHKEPRVVE